MNPYLLLTLYSLAIVAVSLLGGWLPTRLAMSHTRMQCTISFVGGFMLGIGMLHLLPHGIVQSGSVDLVLIATLVGLLFTFFLIRLFHFHQHGTMTSNPDPSHADCDHPHHYHTDMAGPGSGIHELSWTGVAFGLAVHTLLDGVALGAAVMADVAHTPPMLMCGIGVFLAVLLHKPLDAFSITSLMMVTGWSAPARNAASLGFALMCPLGAILFVAGAASFDVDRARLLGMALGFSTGVFLCISLGDLLPEVQFHRHDRFKLSAAMILGVVLSYGVGLLEPADSHQMHGHDLPSTLEPGGRGVR
jgi:zinc and cadmium transporter